MALRKPATEWQPSKNAIDLVKTTEGCVLYAYDDLDPDQKFIKEGDTVHGTLTIGHGHTGRFAKPGNVITEKQASDLLADDLSFAIQQVQQCVTADVSQAEFDALVSIMYNVGPGRPAKGDDPGRNGIRYLRTGAPSTLVMHINMGNYPRARDEFLKWCQTKGAQFGLYKRRMSEALMFDNLPWAWIWEGRRAISMDTEFPDAAAIAKTKIQEEPLTDNIDKGEEDILQAPRFQTVEEGNEETRRLNEWQHQKQLGMRGIEARQIVGPKKIKRVVKLEESETAKQWHNEQKTKETGKMSQVVGFGAAGGIGLLESLTVVGGGLQTADGVLDTADKAADVAARGPGLTFYLLIIMAAAGVIWAISKARQGYFARKKEIARDQSEEVKI